MALPPNDFADLDPWRGLGDPGVIVFTPPPDAPAAEGALAALQAFLADAADVADVLRDLAATTDRIEAGAAPGPVAPPGGAWPEGAWPGDAWPEGASSTGAWPAAAPVESAMDAEAGLIAAAYGGPARAAAVAAAAAAHAATPFDGAGKAVAIIDTGFNWRYDQSNLLFAYDFHGADDGDASVASLSSHGSWVAQVATRVASGVDIIHLKVFDDSGGGASMADIEQALQVAVSAVRLFDIAAVNLSLGFGNATVETLSRLSDEFAALRALGVTTTVAAGNGYASHRDGVNVLAADPSALGVSATDATDAFAGFSQRHAGLTDIAALGRDVFVATADGLYGGYVSGTSFAAPYVAGAAAAIQQAAEAVLGHGLTQDQVLEVLQRSGDPVRGAAAAPGWRVADVDAAVDHFLANAIAYDDGWA